MKFPDGMIVKPVPYECTIQHLGEDNATLTEHDDDENRKEVAFSIFNWASFQLAKIPKHTPVCFFHFMISFFFFFSIRSRPSACLPRRTAPWSPSVASFLASWRSTFGGWQRMLRTTHHLLLIAITHGVMLSCSDSGGVVGVGGALEPRRPFVMRVCGVPDAALSYADSPHASSPEGMGTNDVSIVTIKTYREKEGFWKLFLNKSNLNLQNPLLLFIGHSLKLMLLIIILNQFYSFYFCCL